jgi:hypothetical protein
LPLLPLQQPSLFTAVHPDITEDLISAAILLACGMIAFVTRNIR